MATSKPGRLVQSTQSIESGELVRSAHSLKPEALLKKINGQTRLSELENQSDLKNGLFERLFMFHLRAGDLKVIPVGDHVNVQLAGAGNTR